MTKDEYLAGIREIQAKAGREMRALKLIYQATLPSKEDMAAAKAESKAMATAVRAEKRAADWFAEAQMYGMSVTEYQNELKRAAWDATKAMRAANHNSDEALGYIRVNGRKIHSSLVQTYADELGLK